MELVTLKETVTGLADKSHYDRIRIFGWWIHVHKSQATFTGSDIARCYDDLNYSRPSSFGGYISQLVDKKELLKSSGGYRLENKIREQFGRVYGTPQITVKVTSLNDLVSTIPDTTERAYYQEALICYKYGSSRGAVIMTWNIAF